MKITLISGVLALLVMTSIAAAQNKLYWSNTNDGPLQRADLDGSSVEYLSGAGTGILTAVDVDPFNQKVYWVEKNPNEIWRSDLDGAGAEKLIDLTGPSYGFAVDGVNEMMYWTSPSGEVFGASASGGSVNSLVTGLGYCTEIALDVNGGKMYWVESDGDYPIRSANLDGTDVAVIHALGGGATCNALALDLLNERVYVAHDNPPFGSGQAIVSVGFDGTGAEYTGILPVTSMYGLEIDSSNEKMYWALTGGSIGMGTIGRSNLDGSEVEVLLSGLHRPTDIAIYIIPEPATMSLLALGGLTMLRRKKEAKHV